MLLSVVLYHAEASKETEVGSLGGWAKAGTPGSITRARSTRPQQSTGTMPSLAAAAAGGMPGEHPVAAHISTNILKCTFPIGCQKLYSISGCMQRAELTSQDARPACQGRTG